MLQDLLEDGVHQLGHLCHQLLVSGIEAVVGVHCRGEGEGEGEGVWLACILLRIVRKSP